MKAPGKRSPLRIIGIFKLLKGLLLAAISPRPPSTSFDASMSTPRAAWPSPRSAA